MALEFMGYTRSVIIEDSQQIRQIWYNPMMEQLRIEFSHAGEQYQYENVTREEFGKLVSAESVGKFFNANIRSKPTTKITG